MDFLQIFMLPFSWLMKTLYFLLFENYGLALIVFALLVKVLLFPFSLKGKKSMIQTTMLQGKLTALQKQCGTDKNRYNEELQKLYAKENINPMGGCLWSMLPMLILFPLYAVVRRPLRYLMGLNDTVIAAITAAVTAPGIALVLNTGYPEISIVSAFHTTPAVMAAAQNAATGVTSLFGMNFNFLGIDLAATPTLKFWENGISWATIGLFLIPIISAALSYISSKIMMKTNAMNGSQPEGAAASSNKMMMLMTPLMSLWIGFVMPAGMGIYWIANSVFSVFQEIIAGKMLKKDYEKAAEARAKQEALEKEEEKRRKKELTEERARRIEEEKKNKTKKVPAEKKKDPAIAGASREGIRAYARGHAYDPNRYGDVTPYRDPSVPAPVEAPAPAEKPAPAELTAPTVEATPVETVPVEVTPAEAPAAEAPEEVTEAPRYDHPDYHKDENEKE